jgi:hypothetical protein
MELGGKASMDWEWKSRLDWAAKSYEECSIARRTALGSLFGAGALITTFVAAWVVLFVVSWFWYFGLNRIRELSTAIQGRSGHD